MFTLQSHDHKPCGRSGWPTLVSKKYTLDNYPGYVMKVSYYTGLDVNPMPCVTIQDVNGRQIGPAVHPYESEDIPDDLNLICWLNIWMQGNECKLEC